MSSINDIENEDEDRAIHRIAALAQLYLDRYEELQQIAEEQEENA
jgi:hypothetical protein